MPNIKTFKKKQKEMGRELGKKRPQITRISKMGIFKRKNYRKLKIRLILDLDGTVWSEMDNFNDEDVPDNTEHTLDFIKFCIKSFKSVEIYTFRRRHSAEKILDRVIGQRLRKELTIHTQKHESSYTSRKFKIVPDYDENTLILDNNPELYAYPQLDTVLHAKPQGDFGAYFKYFQRFVEGYVNTDSLRNQIISFVQGSPYFDIPKQSPYTIEDEGYTYDIVPIYQNAKESGN